MPSFNYKCTYCVNKRRKIFDSAEQAAKTVVSCELCYRPMERSYAAPSARVTETLDNGAMVRKVERIQNAQEIYTERGHTPAV